MINRARLERRSRLMRRINVPVRAVLSLPFPTPLGRRVMLLHYTGRKTGRAYRQPVSYVRAGGTLLTPGGGAWKANLREGEPVTIRLRGRPTSGRPELVRDPDEVERLLRVMLASNPRLSSFVPFVHAGRTISRDGIEQAVRHGFCIVRWHLDQTP
jgi:deazaflavin-dependent oxidoreductase (nitroreductase family)